MLQVRELDYHTKDRSILRNISFRGRAGEVIAITGPNGAGKSTLIKILSRELAPSQGNISWNETSLDDFNEQRMAHHRAVLSQNIQVSHDFPVKEIVTMGRYPFFKKQPSENDLAIVQDAMQKTDVTVYEDRSYQKLSGGEKQRVQLSRVIAQVNDRPETEKITQNFLQPKLLLLDEPLNNLDIKHQHRCLEIARKLADEGHLVIMVVHDINIAARYADKILLLKGGEQLAFGKPEEVLEENLLQRCYDLKVMVNTHPFYNCPYVFFISDNTDQVFLSSHAIAQ